jgi:hypothetical protein
MQIYSLRLARTRLWPLLIHTPRPTPLVHDATILTRAGIRHCKLSLNTEAEIRDVGRG